MVLKENNGCALLYGYEYEGVFRLYCWILGSSIERDAKQRTGGTGSLIFSFLVIATTAHNIDGLKFEDSYKMPNLIETYRDKKGNLHAKSAVILKT